MKKKSFTLIEVLVSVVIVALVAIASYTGFFVLTGGNERSRNRLWAVTLSQSALEEVRVAAKNNFDGLETQYAAACVDTGGTPQPTSITGFQQTICITPESSMFKKADVTISWTERGSPRQYNTSLLISRPPEPLPANIFGSVTNVNTGARVSGAQVEITHQTTSVIATTTTATNISCPGHPEHDPKDYHFCDAAGNFQLDTGSWDLRAIHSAYEDFGPLAVSGLSSDEDRLVDIQLTPKPTPAYIQGRFIDGITTLPISPTAYLYEGGANKDNQTASSFNFQITFSSPNPRCFTINTDNTYYINKYVGNFPDCNGWGKSFNYRGWSSAVVDAGGGINCSNPWNGNPSSDRVCVNPGETQDLGNIALVPVPTATLTGYVYQSDGTTPVAGATVYINWYNSTSSAYRYSSATTDGSGYYSALIPAAQELFPDNSSYYNQVRACGNVPRMGCCDSPSTQWACSSWVRIGPAYTGSTLSQDFTLPAGTDQKCGNADGYVVDGKTAGPISAATVSISVSTTTDGAGFYEFKCAAAGYRIPIGNRPVSASKSGYYMFSSAGNNWYASRPQITITENNTTTYENIRLWPAGYGIIRGRIVQSGTTPPVSGATVALDYYSDGSINQTVTTGSDGRFVFSSVNESWPAPEAVGNTYYNQTTRNHSLNVSYTAEYDTATRANLILNNGQDLDLGDIGLPLKGQM